MELREGMEVRVYKSEEYSEAYGTNIIEGNVYTIAKTNVSSVHLAGQMRERVSTKCYFAKNHLIFMPLIGFKRRLNVRA